MRIVSAGAFWPSRRGLSRFLKYIVRARISEFESDMPSHAVGSPRETVRLSNSPCEIANAALEACQTVQARAPHHDLLRPARYSSKPACSDFTSVRGVLLRRSICENFRGSPPSH